MAKDSNYYSNLIDERVNVFLINGKKISGVLVSYEMNDDGRLYSVEITQRNQQDTQLIYFRVIGTVGKNTQEDMHV